MTVVRLVPNQITESIRFDSDAVLESMKGKELTLLLILAEDEDGDPVIEGNCNSGQALILMERLKHKIVFGDD